MSPLTAQAQQSAAQGQQQLSSDLSNASNYGQQYAADTSAANTANQNLNAQAQYMQGAGSGMNQYNTQLSNLMGMYGYNPQTMQNANANMTASTGALNGMNAQLGAAGAFGGANGLTGAQLSNYTQSALAPLQTGASNANAQLGNLNTELGQLTTGANQATTAQVQTEQNTATALNQVYQNAQNQTAQALSQMQYYSGLAQSQGNLNATEQASYAAAQASYAQAQNAIAQIQTYAATAAQASAAATTSQLANMASYIKTNPNASAQEISSALNIPIATAQSLLPQAKTASATPSITNAGVSLPSSSNNSLLGSITGSNNAMGMTGVSGANAQ